MEHAEETLAEIKQVKERGRRLAHGGVWLPALLLAALVLAGALLYRYPFEEPAGEWWSHPYWAGLPSAVRSDVGAYLFWFLGLPLVVLASAAWYRWRGRRVGVKVAWPWFAGVTLVVLALLAVIASIPTKAVTPHDPFGGWQGLLSPLIVVAIATIALGFVERSPGLVFGGVWAGLVTGWPCVSGMGRIPGGQVTLLGVDRPGPVLILAALPLLVVALVSLWRKP
ncbi:hypothetical protein [Amycolatopsis acidicola]|uniref:hypothetical protein n=1 Tax=Amycolatopsis acidicola TaxID=2596893 RepID=UPI001AA0373A|nr:hypothetical protein [Amycolatopsis acidicola]